MKINNKFYKKLLRYYKSWQGDEAGLEKFQKAFFHHKNQKYFARTLRKFQIYILSDKGVHPYRYVKYSVILDLTRVRYSDNFRKLNNLIKLYQPVSSLSVLNDVIRPVWNLCCKMARVVKDEPLALLALGILILCYVNRGVMAQPVNSSTETAQDDQTCPANTSSAHMPTNDLFQNGNNPVLLYDTTRKSPKEKWRKVMNEQDAEDPSQPLTLYDRVYRYIKVEESYAKNLSPEKMSQIKDKICNLIVKEMSDPYLAKNFEAMMASKGFQFIIVDRFEKSPLARGVYTDNNEIKILDPALCFCDDIRSTVAHESVHGGIETERENQNFHGAHNLTSLFPNLSSPYASIQQREELKEAIEKGDKRILNDFQLLHSQNAQGKLTRQEQRQYQQDLDILRRSDYQPRCTMKEVSAEPAIRFSVLRNFDAGKRSPITFGAGLTIYPTHITEVSRKLRIYGRYVANPQEEKAKALILDTYERVQTQAATYQGLGLSDRNDTPEDTAVKEADAEIRANRQPLLDRFYPELVAYHQDRKERESQMLREPAPSLRP